MSVAGSGMKSITIRVEWVGAAGELEYGKVLCESIMDGDFAAATHARVESFTKQGITETASDEDRKVIRALVVDALGRQPMKAKP